MGNKVMNSGYVSLTQIKLLAKELNKGYPFGECYRDSVLVYSVSNGWGQLKIVGKGYKLAEGESIFLNEKGLQGLAYGFYNQNTSNTIYAGSIEYLNTEVNKVVAEKVRNRPTVERLEQSYKWLQQFKTFYAKLPLDVSWLVVNYDDYDLTYDEMEVAGKKFKAILYDLAKENNLELRVEESQNRHKYVLPYYARKGLTGYDVYVSSLKTFLDSKKLMGMDYLLLTSKFKDLYRINKDEYLKELASDASTYVLYLEFLSELFKGMDEFNIVGVLEWRKQASKLRYGKETMQRLARDGKVV